MQYRKKPVVIEAIQWNGDNHGDVSNLASDSITGVKFEGVEPYDLYIETLEGRMFANVGDFIIKGVSKEIYACKPDIFEQTYEKVGD